MTVQEFRVEDTRLMMAEIPGNMVQPPFDGICDVFCVLVDRPLRPESSEERSFMCIVPCRLVSSHTFDVRDIKAGDLVQVDCDAMMLMGVTHSDIQEFHRSLAG
jgi:hypothetical protein